jgi:hypothetical protein
MGGLGRVWWLNGDGLQRSSQSPPFDISGTAFFLKPLKSHLCVWLAVLVSGDLYPGRRVSF